MTAEKPLEIRPAAGPLSGEIEVPGSKSLTNRALILGALADGRVTLRGALESDDTRHLVKALEGLGFEVAWDRAKREIRVEGRGGEIPASRADLHGGNAGTAVRFLVGLVSLGLGTYRIDGDARMRERPIGDLLEGLEALGVSARSELDNGCPPVIVEATGLAGGRASIDGSRSSQFASAILLAAPYAQDDVEVEITGEAVGAPFIDMTIGMMGRQGVRVERHGREIRVRTGQTYRPGTIDIEPDATAASYFLAAAAIAGGEVTVRGLSRDSLQGDIGFAEVLKAMGMDVRFGARGLTARSTGTLTGIERDFRDISDTFLTAAVLAPFASTRSVISGITHTRKQESDRVTAVATELRRLGITVEERSDALVIEPGVPSAAVIETYGDHRIAMSFALVGLRVPGIQIANPGCVTKTYPRFFEDLARLVARAGVR